MLLLKPSRIHGVGVFTTKFVRKGENLGDLLFSVRDWKWSSRQDPGKYGVRAARDGWYVPKDIHRLCCGWYLNHSDRPNIEADGDQERWTATRAIRAGEELTINYQALEGDAFAERLRKSASRKRRRA